MWAIHDRIPIPRASRDASEAERRGETAAMFASAFTSTRAWLTCESYLDEVQRMQHQGRDDAAWDARDKILVLDVAQDVELARRGRRTAILDRRHVPRNVAAVAIADINAGAGAVVPLAVHLRYRSGDNRIRILANVSNARLHSAAYLLIHGRHCRRTVVTSNVTRPRNYHLLRSLLLSLAIDPLALMLLLLITIT